MSKTLGSWLVVVCSQSVRRWMASTIDDPEISLLRREKEEGLREVRGEQQDKPNELTIALTINLSCNDISHHVKSVWKKNRLA